MAAVWPISALLILKKIGSHLVPTLLYLKPSTYTEKNFADYVWMGLCAATAENLFWSYYS